MPQSFWVFHGPCCCVLWVCSHTNQSSPCSQRCMGSQHAGTWHALCACNHQATAKAPLVSTGSSTLAQRLLQMFPVKHCCFRVRKQRSIHIQIVQHETTCHTKAMTHEKSPLQP